MVLRKPLFRQDTGKDRTEKDMIFDHREGLGFFNSLSFAAMA